MLSGRSSQRPAIHRAQPAAVGRKIRPTATVHPRSSTAAGAAAKARGVDNHYESPATEPKLQGCTKDHAMIIKLLWNKIDASGHHAFHA